MDVYLFQKLLNRGAANMDMNAMQFNRDVTTINIAKDDRNQEGFLIHGIAKWTGKK